MDGIVIVILTRLRDGYAFIPPSINQTSTDVRESIIIIMLRGSI